MFHKINKFLLKAKIISLPTAESIPTVSSEKIKKLTPEEIFLTPKNFYKEADIKILKNIMVATFVIDKNN